jgi:hypothetical protein
LASRTVHSQRSILVPSMPRWWHAQRHTADHQAGRGSPAGRRGPTDASADYQRHPDHAGVGRPGRRTSPGASAAASPAPRTSPPSRTGQEPRQSGQHRPVGQSGHGRVTCHRSTASSWRSTGSRPPWPPGAGQHQLEAAVQCHVDERPDHGDVRRRGRASDGGLYVSSGDTCWLRLRARTGTRAARSVLPIGVRPAEPCSAPPGGPPPRRRARPAKLMVAPSRAATKRRTAQPGWGQTTPPWEQVMQLKVGVRQAPAARGGARRVVDAVRGEDRPSGRRW